MKDNQLVIGQLVGKIQELETENSRLHRIVESTGRKTRSRKSDTGVPDSLLSHVDTINILGKKFAIMTYPWLKSTAFTKLTGRPSLMLTGVLRYQTPECEDLALTAELYDNIPSKLHHLMQGEPKFGEL